MKLKLAAALGQNYSLNSKGAMAYAQLFDDMAFKLDLAKDLLQDKVTTEGNNV